MGIFDFLTASPAKPDAPTLDAVLAQARSSGAPVPGLENADAYGYGALPSHDDIKGVMQTPGLSGPAQTAMFAGSLPYTMGAAATQGAYQSAAGLPDLARQAHAEGPFGGGSGYSDDTLGRIIALTGNVGMGSAPMPRPAGSLGIFGGKGAATADLEALQQAKASRSLRGMTGYEDVDKDSILKDTGWFKGLDGQWKHEIDDSGSAFTGSIPDVGDPSAKLGSFFSHPDLYAAYPEMADINVNRIGPTASNSGVFRPGMDENYAPIDGLGTIGLRDNDHSVLLHELQHAVQQREGFAQGYDMRQGRDRYMNSAGEVEARAVESRQTMKPEDRRAAGVWFEGGLPDPSQQWMPTSLKHVPLTYD